MSRTSPSWSTARQRYIRLPAIRITISSRAIGRLGDSAPSKPSRDHRSELQHPASDGLIGYVEPALGEEILDISIAEGETQVEPDSMLDDDRGKAVAAV